MKWNRRVRVGFFLGLCGLLTGWSFASGAESLVFAAEDTSTHFRAVFAQFLSVVPSAEAGMSVDSAISISNVCAAPEEVQFVLGQRSNQGAISVFLYDRDGTLIAYRTDSPLGAGLNADGTLGPGQTWTVRLAEVISRAQGIPESQIEFNGYGWFLSGFDCLVGTYSNTIFGLGFTQSYEMLPGMGQGPGFFGGLMIPQN
jgi:hypothetical protein